ncbi:hypothetical protein [Kibdelosporangium philippinense]|uniref:hypothetical protein n=1 Tax=Kibdelosporangium philippinense TaxID=211113 RepID=UPI003612DC2E
MLTKVPDTREGRPRTPMRPSANREWTVRRSSAPSRAPGKPAGPGPVVVPIGISAARWPRVTVAPLVPSECTLVSMSRPIVVGN